MQPAGASCAVQEDQGPTRPDRQRGARLLLRDTTQLVERVPWLKREKEKKNEGFVSTTPLANVLLLFARLDLSRHCHIR